MALGVSVLKPIGVQSVPPYQDHQFLQMLLTALMFVWHIFRYFAFYEASYLREGIVTEANIMLINENPKSHWFKDKYYRY